MQVETTEAFDAWLDSLKDHMTRIRLSRRLDKAMRGLLGDVQPVGEGFSKCVNFSALAGACTTSSAGPS